MGLLRSHRHPLIGRLWELEQIPLLFSEGERLVTLLAPPGAGKTHLALELANQEEEAGTLAGLAELSEVRAAQDLARRIVDALGVPPDGAADDDQLVEALAARGPQLLVLDGCEHLEPSALALIESFIERAPLLRILATSLIPLRLEDEHPFALPPLRLEEAAALYERQARRSDPDAPLEAGAVESLVEQLDRNPLAIQLAAARVRTLRPRHLLARIDQRFALLRGGPPGRHESLGRALACSWELLAPHEASALVQMAIFAGGFDLEAAEAVIDLSEHPEAPPIVDVVDELRKRVLIGATEADPPRFTLPESVRAFAHRELERTGRLAATAERHAACYLGRDPLAQDGFFDAWELRRFRVEEQNLRAVIRHFEGKEPAWVARAALCLTSLLEGRGFAGSTSDLETLRVNAIAADDPLLLAAALRTLGRAHANRGEIDEARATLGRARELALQAGAPLLAFRAVADLGFAETLGDRPEQASPLLEEALRGARELGQPRLEAYAELLAGIAANQTGQWDASTARGEGALRLLAHHDAPGIHANALINLGNARATLGELDVARLLLERGRTVAREAEDPLSESVAMLNLGNVAIIEGRIDEGEALLIEVRANERRFGRPRFEAMAAGNLATVAFERGHLREARQLLAEALITFRGVGNAFYDGAFSSVHGAVLAASGELLLAARELEVARERLRSIDDRELLRMHEVLLGFVDLARARDPNADAEGCRAAARARLEAGRSGRPGGPTQIALRILALALDGWSETSPPEPTEAGAPAEAALVVGAEGNWFEIDGAPRVEMRRRKAIRRVFHALVTQRQLAPGLGLDPEQLFAVGWPNERARPEAAAMRVYHAIKVLRQAGLENALLRHGDGYLLDPERPLLRAVPEPRVRAAR